MRKQFSKQFLFFCFICLAFTLQAVDLPSYKFKYYNTDNGLSSDNINCIFQDRDGFMWIGTNGGLNRYDGSRTVNFSTEFSELTSFLISYVSQDSAGYIWIGTKDAGLFRYNPKNNQFFNIKKTTLETPGLRDNYVFSCVSDDNNQLWVTTQQGLVLLDLKHMNENYVKIKDMTSALPKEGSIRFVLPRKDKYLLSFSAHSLTVIEHLGEKKERKRLLTERVFAAKEDAHGTLWVNWVEHIYKVVEGKSIADFQLIDYPLLKDGQPYDVGEINCLTFDLSGRLWIGTSENGVFSAKIDEENKIIKILSHSYLDVTKVGSLTNNMVRHLWVDKTNVLWIGTEGGGVNLLDLEVQDFKNVYSLDANANSKVVRSVCEDNNENLWLGIDASGLYFLPASEDYSSEMQLVTFDDEVLSGVLKSISYIYETADGIIWIGTEGRGLLSLTHHYNAHTQKLSYQIHSLPTYNNRIINGVAITSMLEAPDGALWIATYSTGLKRAYRNGLGLIDEVDHFSYDSDLEQSISSNIVRSLACSSNGDIWVGTGQGINKIIRQKDNDNVFFKRYLTGDAGLTNDYILPLHFADDGDLWVGTLGGGLFCYDSERDFFKHYSTKDGLPNDVVKSIVEDDEDMLWISSNKGLSKFDKQLHSFVNFTVADGLKSNSFNELSCVKRENGELLFGGVNGLTAFLPEEIKSNPYLSTVKLTGVKIFNQKITVGEKFNGRILLAENLMFTDQLKLHHDENSLEFDFSALHYSPNYKSHIRYQLEGFDDDWNYLLGGEMTFKYTNLPSGRYKLILESYNDDDVDKCTSAAVYLTICSPWWLSVPAFIVYFLLFITLLYLFSRFSLIQNNKKNELLLERIEKEKIDEMTQLKLDFFTKISHEFRTPLTLIIGTIDSLFGNDHSYSRKRDVIQRNVNSILRLTRQLTDFRKYEQGQLEMKVGANNIISFVHNVFDSFDSVAQQKNIDFKYVKTQENIELWFDADKIEKVLFNLISNAIKFTPADGCVSIEVIEKKDDVEILINDSGVGIPKQKQAHIFEMFYRADKGNVEGTGVGLAFSKNMVEMHRGDLSFQSSENHGAQFKFSLKKGKAHFSSGDFYESKTGGDFVLDYANGREWKNPIAITNKRNGLARINAPRVSLLVVEDQLEVRRFIIENLQEHYDILEASNGREGFDKCLQQLPDLVISDVMMSEMTGLELCKSIKENVTTRHIPVMLLSARDEVSDLIKGYDYDADAYVTKPFHIQVLKARIASLIKNRQRIINQTVNKVTLEPMGVNISKADERFLNRAMKVMEKNIGNGDYHVNSFAKDLGFSSPHLNRKFKKLLDKTTIRFMQEVRLKRAVQLLKLETPVSDVADETGYNSVRRFRDSFKDHYKLSPSEYISSLREE